MSCSWLNSRTCRRRLAGTWEERRRADAMDLRRTSTHSLHSSAVPASGWGEGRADSAQEVVGADTHAEAEGCATIQPFDVGLHIEGKKF